MGSGTAAEVEESLFFLLLVDLVRLSEENGLGGMLRDGRGNVPPSALLAEEEDLIPSKLDRNAEALLPLLAGGVTEGSVSVRASGEYGL